MRPFAAFFAAWFALAQINSAQSLQPLLNDVSLAYSKLEPQTIRPAEGRFKQAATCLYDNMKVVVTGY